MQRWNDRGHAWTTAAEIEEATRYYLLGQNVGSEPLINGLCARCGLLLHGFLNSSKSAGNKVNGPPRTADDQLCTGPREQQAARQPPFLLRWSPSLLAAKLPAVFVWEAATNRLSLREEFRACPPWRVHPGAGARDALTNSWLYCRDCDSSLKDATKQRVPFRDRQSAAAMQQDRRDAAVAHAPPEAPAEEARPGDSSELAAYRAKWAALLQDHERAPGGAFGFENLVPEPRSELWQDAPHSPLGQLKSADAQGKMAVCRLESCMEEGEVKDGVTTYAYTVGGSNFWRPAAGRGPPPPRARRVAHASSRFLLARPPSVPAPHPHPRSPGPVPSADGPAG